MPYLNETFKALLKEAQFTNEMLGSGATQIRSANYGSKGVYFQAFSSLSTGLERIGKLCLMLDHYIETRGSFPDLRYMKREIGHRISLLYEKSQDVLKRRSLVLGHLQDLTNPVHQAIVKILHDFAEGDRYSNIDLLIGSTHSTDPIAEWFRQVDLPLFNTQVSERKKQRIALNASITVESLQSHSFVLHTSETGGEITDLQEASHRTGVYESVSPYRQLYVLQVIRYWAELISELGSIAQRTGNENIPYFGELFAAFKSSDSMLRSRKTWDGR